MKILAIDPGTHMGWCVMENGKILDSGTAHLSGKNTESRGMRFIRAKHILDKLLFEHQDIKLVAFEAVKRWASSDAAFIYNGMLAQLVIVCTEKNKEFVGYAATEIKKATTGNGKADKQLMIDTAEKLYGIKVEDDNEADAILCARLATERLSS